MFSTFQLARNGIQKVKTGTSEALTMACAPLYVSAKGDVISVAALVTKIAGAASTGGLTGLLP